MWVPTFCAWGAMPPAGGGGGASYVGMCMWRSSAGLLSSRALLLWRPIDFAGSMDFSTSAEALSRDCLSMDGAAPSWGAALVGSSRSCSASEPMVESSVWVVTAKM